MLYLGLYDEAGRASFDGPVLIAPDEAARLLPARSRIAVGSGARASRRGMRAAVAGSVDAAPCPSFSRAPLRSRRLRSKRGETSPTLRPLYLRPPDARPQAAEAWRGADDDRGRGPSRHAARRSRHGGDPCELLSRKAWDEAAMAQFIAGPERLCLIASSLDSSAGGPQAF